ncbi:MAG: 2-phosphosulfolactate phosphatase [Balneolaceae bacterium]
MANLNSLDVFFSVHSFQEEELRDRVVVVADVLRATSTIVTAIHNGARGVIPVADMGEASKIAQNVDSDNYLLCGEKDGVMIEGYDLGNSPLEYTPERVKGKTLIFNTTNGTKALRKSFSADEVYIAAFLNLDQVVEKLSSVGKDVVIVCSGWKGRLSMEDLLLAGSIIYHLGDGNLPSEARDGAKVAFSLYEKFGKDLASVILNSNHGFRLRNLNSVADIEYCSQVNTHRVLPVLHEGIITDQYVTKTG